MGEPESVHSVGSKQPKIIVQPVIVKKVPVTKYIWYVIPYKTTEYVTDSGAVERAERIGQKKGFLRGVAASASVLMCTVLGMDMSYLAIMTSAMTAFGLYFGLMLCRRRGRRFRFPFRLPGWM